MKCLSRIAVGLVVSLGLGVAVVPAVAQTFGTGPVMMHGMAPRAAVEGTAKGSLITQTSDDAKVVIALQEHAAEVDELVRDGMAAMMRNMRARMTRHSH